MSVFFFIFWIRYVQNGSNLIKLDQIGFPHQSKNVTKGLSVDEDYDYL